MNQKSDFCFVCFVLHFGPLLIFLPIYGDKKKKKNATFSWPQEHSVIKCHRRRVSGQTILGKASLFCSPCVTSKPTRWGLIDCG